MTFSPSVIWFIFAIACFCIEILLPVGAFIFIAVGALAAWIVALLEFSLTYQLLAFALVSLLTLLLFRKQFSRIFSGKAKEATPDNLSYLQGMLGSVVKEIPEGQEGEVKIAGSYWRARLLDGGKAISGEKIIVVQNDPADATLLLVKKL